jgi:aminoglycoside phosphotransferase (APT) family kinase protein
MDVAAHHIPTQAAFVQRYCHHAGRELPAALEVFIVFSMFRLASILAGVYKRALDGNAADARALSQRERYRAVAEVAWALAQRCA